MYYIRFISAMLLAGGVALSAPADDPNKPAAPTTAKAGDRTAGPPASAPSVRHTPPVLRNPDVEDTSIVLLPGSSAPAKEETRDEDTATPPAPSLPPADDPERPVLRRSTASYPAEFGAESGVFCQKQIGSWTEDDAIAVLGEPKRHRPSLNDDGAENGDIFAFTDPSSRYRELELDFDDETGTLRTVFAYPWKMSWQECRKLWGTHVSTADADKGRTFYSYLDRRLDVLVDPAGKVISLGLY
jgi:hypothetical protein